MLAYVQGAWCAVVATVLMVGGCDRGPHFVGQSPVADGAFDSGGQTGDGGAQPANDSAAAPPRVGPIADAQVEDACLEGDVCLPSSACRLGKIHCSSSAMLCEPQGAPYVPRNVRCGAGSACDGNGNCISCGEQGMPCCGSLCYAGGACGGEGTCVTCEEEAACQPENVCRTGVQHCTDERGAQCEESGDRMRSTPCGVAEAGGLLACDGQGACIACGGDGQPCCNGSCGTGSTCDVASSTCFTCTPGAVCEPGNACRIGVESCGGGMRSCVDVNDQARGLGCGEGKACDGSGACESCGGDGQPCCGDLCSTGFACDASTFTCFDCAKGEACTSDAGCRTGTLSCAQGEALCIEDADVQRSTSCGEGADKACDGAGLCAACGGEGEVCCGTRCDSGVFCDATRSTCTTCAAGEACTSPNGCKAGTRTCAGGATTCEASEDVARAKSCGDSVACDGSGECVDCGGPKEPCCGTACDAGTLCSVASATCQICPASMVLIPGGYLDMGADVSDALAAADERPVHRITLPSFCADLTEVTVAAYQDCGDCTAANIGTGCNAGSLDRDTHPINCVDHAQASAYCAAMGARLPTEAEWEYLARTTVAQLYPWGDTAASCEYANANGCVEDTVEVASLANGRSPLGLWDMAGNVAEWVSDRYSADFYASERALGDQPLGPESGAGRGVRGGGWDSAFDKVRGSARDAAAESSFSASRGFRCVKDLD